MYQCTIDLLFDWFGISCLTTGNFCFYLQNSLIQTSQTGDQWYSDTLVFPVARDERFGLFFLASTTMKNIFETLTSDRHQRH
jgi:hypothetical protein